jgi:hypothetical protein
MGNGNPMAQLLLLIENHFEDAAKVVQDLAVGDDIATASLDNMSDKKSLVQGMRDILIERHGRVSVTTKAKWVIYQKDKLSGPLKNGQNSSATLEVYCQWTTQPWHQSATMKRANFSVATTSTKLL